MKHELKIGLKVKLKFLFFSYFLFFLFLDFIYPGKRKRRKMMRSIIPRNFFDYAICQ